jgi:hypothetical protein
MSISSNPGERDAERHITANSLFWNILQVSVAVLVQNRPHVAPNSFRWNILQLTSLFGIFCSGTTSANIRKQATSFQIYRGGGGYLQLHEHRHRIKT